MGHNRRGGLGLPTDCDRACEEREVNLRPDRDPGVRRGWVASMLLVLIALIGSLGAVAVQRYSAYFSQRGARELLLKLFGALLMYAVVFGLTARI